MSTIRKLSLVFVLVVTIVGCAPAPTPIPLAVPTPMPQPTQLALPQQIQIVQPEKRSIAVVGEGEVKVKPDMVEFSIDIETERRTTIEAKKANDEITIKIFGVIKNYEIHDKDIQTTYITVRPHFDYLSSTVRGYYARHYINVTVRDLTKFENLCLDILEAGASSINSIDFQVADIKQYEEQARTLALQNAKEKAVSMAKTLEQEIGVPLSIQEVIKNKGLYYPTYVLSTAVLADATFESASTIAYGQLTITATVTVEFELK